MSRLVCNPFTFGLAALALSGSLMAAEAQSVDYAESSQAGQWLRHPVYGDPSFDSFERLPGNPIHRGAPPFEWPVNGFFFPDPVSGNWYVYVGDYGKGYLTPPSRCLLYRSMNRGKTWTQFDVVLQGDAQMFDRGGHTPDVSVVYADHRYHMVYDWGETNFNAEGGLAYAWAERPEGPWHRTAEPLTRNSTLPKLLGRYQRTYAATLLKREHDWLILAMMDFPPHAWALFVMTAPKPEGPYSERRLLRHVEADFFHPPLLEFFPAFEHKGYVYAPATSVALNRNFNAVFRAPLAQADDPAAWTVFQNGSAWHAEDVEHERYGLWGQTFSGAVDRRGVLRVMFPSRDSRGQGTISLAQRPWNQPYKKRGFVLTGHQGPSLTLLRQAYEDFTLDALIQPRGTVRLLLDYAAPLSPNLPCSDATLHPLMNTRHSALELSLNTWRLVCFASAGGETVLALGRLPAVEHLALRLSRQGDFLVAKANNSTLWTGPLPPPVCDQRTGVLGLQVETNTHLLVEKFLMRGCPKPARLTFGHSEALLGAGEPPAYWTEKQDPAFRFGLGIVARKPGARVKWNVVGQGLQLWSPRGPEFGKAEVRLDGQTVASLDLFAEKFEPSCPVWQSSDLQDAPHAVVLSSTNGHLPVDSLDVWAGTGVW